MASTWIKSEGTNSALQGTFRIPHSHPPHADPACSNHRLDTLAADREGSSNAQGQTTQATTARRQVPLPHSRITRRQPDCFARRASRNSSTKLRGWLQRGDTRFPSPTAATTGLYLFRKAILRQRLC